MAVSRLSLILGARPGPARFLVVTIAANVIAVVQGLAGFPVLDAAVAGTITEAWANAYDAMTAVTGLAQAVLYLLTGIAVFAWLSRVVENIPPLTGYTPRRSPREAIGWWFVPFANYVVPFLIVGDAMERLRTSFSRGAERLVVPWWITFVLMNLASALNIQAGSRLTTLDSIRALFTFRVADDVVWVAGGVLLFLIVWAMEERSERRAAYLGLARSGVARWPRLRTPSPNRCRCRRGRSRSRASSGSP